MVYKTQTQDSGFEIQCKILGCSLVHQVTFKSQVSLTEPHFRSAAISIHPLQVSGVLLTHQELAVQFPVRSQWCCHLLWPFHPEIHVRKPYLWLRCLGHKGPRLDFTARRHVGIIHL